MKLVLVRHGDPDYENDALTEAGKKEVQLLVPRMLKENVKDFYVSPLGRARATAQPTLDAFGREAEVKDWLKEFPAIVRIEENKDMLLKIYPDTPKNADGTYKNRIVWDMMPGSWRDDERFFMESGWRETPLMQYTDMPAVYDYVCEGLDQLLEKYGYLRDGNLYKTKKGTNDTIVCFCHFGLICVLLSHLFHVSPFVLWHSLALAPSSVSEIYTEEREEGKVIFRAARLGDISHLYAGNTEPEFSARFCQAFDNDERH